MYSLLLVSCSPQVSDDVAPSKPALDLNNSAVRALQEGDPEEALRLVNRAIEIEPKFCKAYVNKAGILNELGRMDEAIAALHAAVQLNPDYAEAYLPLGVLLEKTGRKDEAAARYAKARDLYETKLQKAPNDAAAVIDRAIALFLLNDRRLALNSLKEFLAKNPRDEHANIVKVKIEAGDRAAFINGAVK
jgi:tetratricopeptide (TPR) repeat protein